MFVSRSDTRSFLYSFDKGVCRIHDESGKQVDEVQSDFPISNEHYSVKQPHLCVVVTANRKQVAQICEYVCELVEDGSGAKWVKRCKILGIKPNQNWNEYQGKLFSLEGRIFVTNGFTIYSYADGRLQPFQKKSGSFYYSFMNKAIRWVPREAVYRLILKDNFIYEEKLFDCSASVLSLISPIMIFNNKEQTQFVCYSFLDDAVSTTDDSSLCQKEIHQILQMKPFGWSLPPQIQQKLFTTEKSAEEEFAKYIQSQQESGFEKVGEVLDIEEAEEEQEEETVQTVAQVLHVNEPSKDNRLDAIEKRLSSLEHLVKSLCEGQELMIRMLQKK